MIVCHVPQYRASTHAEQIPRPSYLLSMRNASWFLRPRRRSLPKRRTERTQPAGAQPIDHCSHGMLANAKMHLRPPGDPAARSPPNLSSNFVLVDGARSADPPISQGNVAASAFSTLPEAPGLPCPCRPARTAAARSPSLPVVRASATVQLLRFVRMLLFIGVELDLPAGAGEASALPDAFGEVFVGFIRNEKGADPPASHRSAWSCGLRRRQARRYAQPLCSAWSARRSRSRC